VEDSCLIGSDETSKQIANEPITEASLIGSFSGINQQSQQENSPFGSLSELLQEPRNETLSYEISKQVVCEPVEETSLIGSFSEASSLFSQQDVTYENFYNKSEIYSVDELLRGSGPSSHEESSILERSLYLESDEKQYKEDEYSNIPLSDLVMETIDAGSCDGVDGSVGEEKVEVESESESEEDHDFVMVD